MVLKVPIYLEVDSKLSPSEVRILVQKCQKYFSLIIREDQKEENFGNLVLGTKLKKEGEVRLLSEEEVLEHMRKGF